VCVDAQTPPRLPVHDANMPVRSNTIHAFPKGTHTTHSYVWVPLPSLSTIIPSPPPCPLRLYLPRGAEGRRPQRWRSRGRLVSGCGGHQALQAQRQPKAGSRAVGLARERQLSGPRSVCDGSSGVTRVNQCCSVGCFPCPCLQTKQCRFHLFSPPIRAHDLSILTSPS